MQFSNSAAVLAVLAFGSVVSAAPSAEMHKGHGVDTSVTYDDYVKNFDVKKFGLDVNLVKGPRSELAAPETSKRSDGPDMDVLEKRWTSSTCAFLGDTMLPMFGRAVQLCDIAINSINSGDAKDRRRFAKFFGYYNDVPSVRNNIIYRYNLIKQTIYAQNYNIVCLPNTDKGSVIATTFYQVPNGQGNPATTELYRSFFSLPLDAQCSNQPYSKADIIVHEASHVFGSADHGSDPSNDAYMLQWFSGSAAGNCDVTF